MPKSQPLSVRLPERIIVQIQDEAKRTKRSKGAVAESLIDEALHCRRFPGIGFRGQDWNRRPWILGTALDVWEVIWSVRNFGSAKKVTEALEITEAQIELAEAYYRESPEGIDSHIAAINRPFEELRREFPSVQMSAASGPNPS